MILQTLKELIPWVTPPVIGAIIGYVTNDIAIRMLFRPLKEIRVFGIRLPFTPGIFPKERYVLSHSIGKMVSRELITEQAVRAQIHAEKTVNQLAKSISSLSAQLLDTPLSKLSDNVSTFFTGSLEELLRDILHRFFTSRAVIYAVRDVLSRVVASLSGSKVREIVTRYNLRSMVSERLLPLLAEKNTRESLAKSVAAAITERTGDLVSDRLIDTATGIVKPLLDPAIDHFVEWLQSPDMRAELTTQGKKLVSGILEKLNLLQRFILTAGQFERKLDEKMPEIVDDTIATLEVIAREPRTQERLISMLGSAVRDWRDGRSSAESGTGKEKLGGALAGIVEDFLAGLEKPNEREKVTRLLEEKLLGDGDSTLGSLARKLFGLRDDEIVEKLSYRILDYLTKKDTADLLSRELLGFVSRFLQDSASTPIGALLRVDGAKKAKLDDFLTNRLVSLVDAKLPEILRGIDVEELVVKKIDALDVRDVEKLLLQIIAEHLKWIDVFGAILGFIIGLFQILLKVLRLS